MQISELEQEAGVPAKTIRYYESIDLLPAPDRQPNGYRVYERADVARLRLVAGARRLDFSLAEIREILDLWDRGEAPCLTLLRAAEFKTWRPTIRSNPDCRLKHRRIGVS